jgi:hypothetical protein
MIRTSARAPVYAGALLWVVMAIPPWVFGCLAHRARQAPTATATVTPNTVPTFSPDSFPDLERVTR